MAILFWRKIAVSYLYKKLSYCTILQSLQTTFTNKNQHVDIDYVHVFSCWGSSFKTKARQSELFMSENTILYGWFVYMKNNRWILEKVIKRMIQIGICSYQMIVINYDMLNLLNKQKHIFSHLQLDFLFRVHMYSMSQVNF